MTATQQSMRGPARTGSASGRSAWALTLPALVVLSAVYLLPIAVMFVMSFTDPVAGLSNYRELAEPAYLRLAWRTIVIAAGATVICLLLGYPVAYAIVRARPFVKALLVVGVLSPYLTSMLVRTFAWEVLLGRLGPIPTALRALGFSTGSLLQTWVAVVIGLVHILLPLMVLSLVAVMSRVDLTLLRASRSLGAGPAESFLRVFVPLTLPAIEVGCVLVFAYGIGSFLTPAILGGQDGAMLGVVIESNVNEFADLGGAAAFAVALTVMVLIVLAVYRWAMAGRMEWLATRDSIPTRGRRAKTRSRRGPASMIAAGAVAAARFLDRTGVSRASWLYRGFALVVVGFLALPQLVTIPVSFSGTRTLVFPPRSWSGQWYEAFLTDEWLEPLRISVIVAAVAAAIATTLALLAAIGVERGAGARRRAVASGFLLLPLILPLVVAATGFYLVFVRVGLTDSVLGLILAHTCLLIPYAFAVLSANVRTLDPIYERAATSLGDSRWGILRRVILPLLLPGLTVAVLFCFLTSFDEAVVAIFITGIDVKTLPRQMFDAVVQQSDPTIAVVGTVSLGASLLVAAGAGFAQRWSRRRQGRRSVI
jgi:putative spermidine/putrescine transport system permease protein